MEPPLKLFFCVFKQFDFYGEVFDENLFNHLQMNITNGDYITTNLIYQEFVEINCCLISSYRKL